MMTWINRALSLLILLPPLGVMAGTVTYYHNDLAGNPVAATNEEGQVIWRESYRPYGERLIKSAAASRNGIWFTSRHQDADTGLVYMGARYYDPVVGRFLSRDPVEFDEQNLHSFNRYAYANNNPHKFIDPDGRSPLLLWITRATGAGYGAGVMADAASQYAAWGTVDWSLALSSSSAQAGAAAGLMSPAPGMSFGLTIEKVGVEGLHEAGRLTSSNPTKSIDSLRARISEHRQKIQDYLKNPDAFDHNNMLRNAPNEEIRQKIIDGRVRHL